MRRKSQEQYDQKLIGLGVYRVEKYVDTHKQILHRCVCGNEWLVSPHNVLAGRRCGCFSNHTKTAKPKWAGNRSGGGWLWTPREDVFIKKHAVSKTAAWIAEQLGRTEDAVRLRANVVLKLSLLFAVEEKCPGCGDTFIRSRTVKCCKLCTLARAKTRGNEQGKKWAKEHSEQRSVRGHYSYIFDQNSRSHANYKGMPFYDGWNPDKGGSFEIGAQWIIDNLGKRPEGTSIHVIKHGDGFVPGNLEWTYPRKQNNQQMYKIIAQQHNEIKNLKRRLIEAEQVLILYE